MHDLSWFAFVLCYFFACALLKGVTQNFLILFFGSNYLKSSRNSKSKVSFEICFYEDFITDLTLDIWLSKTWDNWGKRHQRVSFSLQHCHRVVLQEHWAMSRMGGWLIDTMAERNTDWLVWGVLSIMTDCHNGWLAWWWIGIMSYDGQWSWWLMGMMANSG